MMWLVGPPDHGLVGGATQLWSGWWGHLTVLWLVGPPDHGLVGGATQLWSGWWGHLTVIWLVRPPDCDLVGWIDLAIFQFQICVSDLFDVV